MMIETKELTKFYGKVKGISELNLTVHTGEIFGFIGPNGAGKSTIIRLMLSLIFPTSGSVWIDGKDCYKDSRAIKEILGYVPSEVHYYEDMKVYELFDYSSKFYKKDCSVKYRQLAQRLGLNLDKKINALSYGNKKKVAIIQALLHEPKVLIFDEPTSGLDPLVQNEFFDILLDEKAKGTTILFSSHVLSEVQKICDRVGFIKDGELLLIEEVHSLRQNNFRQIELQYGEKSTPPSFLELSGTSNFLIKEKNISFLYTGKIQPLLRILSTNMNLENITITEPSLEEIFIHYYEERRE